MSDDREAEYLRLRFEDFVRQWAPAEPQAAAHFHSELFMLVRAIQSDAARPYEVTMRKMMEALPLVHFVPKVDVT